MLKVMAKKPLFLALVAIATLAVVVPMTLLGLPYGRFDPEAFAHLYTLPPPHPNQTHLHIDADATNGARPCDPLDDEALVGVGRTHSVGVCLETYAPNTVNNFELHVRYTGDPDATTPTTINLAPTVACAGADGNSARVGTDGDSACLDANPDANDGDDPTGFKLGGGWDCSGFTVAPPVGDDPSTPNVADAFIVCYANLATPDQDLSADPGLLATITFTATGVGDDFIDFGDVDASNNNIVYSPLVPSSTDNVARCGTSVPEDQVGCFYATIHKVDIDCEFNDDFGRGTSLIIWGNNWRFTWLGGQASGIGRVVHMGSRVMLLGRGQGNRFFLAGFGTCPSGPGRFYGLAGSSFLRLQDTSSTPGVE
jgi:hypothetical protein